MSSFQSGNSTTGVSPLGGIGTGIFGNAAAQASAGNAGTGGTSNSAANTTGGSFFNTGKTTMGTTSGGLFGNTGGSTAPTGNLFGGGSAANPLTSTGSNPLGALSNSPFGASTNTGSSGTFGGGSTLFGATKPAEQGIGSTLKPPTTSFFAQPSTSSTSTLAPAGGVFGIPPKPADSTPAPTSGVLGGGSLPGGSLFAKQPDPTTSASTTAAPPTFGLFSSNSNKDTASAAPGGGIFGNLGAAKDKVPPAVAVPPSSNLFGAAKDTSSEKKDSSTAPPTFSLGASSVTAEAQGSMAPSASSTAGVPPPSTLRGKSIEDIVNKWSTELESHVREFNKFAGEVAVWDRALIENSNTLAALYSHVLAAERDQNDIDQSLDHIEQQQRDLSATLDAYEKSTQDILGGQGGSLRAIDTGPADTERDKNYMLATDLHTHMDDFSTSLTQIIESVNSLTQPSSQDLADVSTNGEDPLARITQILSNHLESLQWIDGAVREVEGRVTDVEKRVKQSNRGSSGVNGFKSRGFGLNR